MFEHHLKVVADLFYVMMQRTRFFGPAVFKSQSARPVDLIAIDGRYYLAEHDLAQTFVVKFETSCGTFNGVQYFAPGKLLQDFGRKGHRGIDVFSYFLKTRSSSCKGFGCDVCRGLDPVFTRF